MAAETGHTPNRSYVDRDGHLHLNGACLFDSAENDQKRLVASPTALGCKIAYGVLNTSTTPETIVTGLSTVVSCLAVLADDPGDDPLLVSATIGDQAGAPAAGSIIIKSWKTNGTDPTPAAATTFSKLVNWVAIGT